MASQLAESSAVTANKAPRPLLQFFEIDIAHLLGWQLKKQREVYCGRGRPSTSETL